MFVVGGKLFVFIFMEWKKKEWEGKTMRQILNFSTWLHSDGNYNSFKLDPWTLYKIYIYAMDGN